MLLGSRTTRDECDPLLDPRFEREGYFFLRHGEFDWSGTVAELSPRPAAHRGPVPVAPGRRSLRPAARGQGALLGILSVDEPVSGCAPAATSARARGARRTRRPGARGRDRGPGPTATAPPWSTCSPSPCA